MSKELDLKAIKLLYNSKQDMIDKYKAELDRHKEFEIEPAYGLTYFIAYETSKQLEEYLQYKNDQGENVELCIYFSIVKDPKHPQDSNDRFLIPNSKLSWPGEVDEYAPGKFRGTCTWLTNGKGKMHKYVFHTHPFSSYSFPSIEDIHNVLKYEELSASVIATRWGIWVIKPGEGSYGFRQLKKEKADDIMFSAHKTFLDKIYDIETALPSESTLPNKEYKLVEIIMNDLGRYLRLEFKLYRWEDINGDIKV